MISITIVTMVSRFRGVTSQVLAAYKDCSVTITVFNPASSRETLTERRAHAFWVGEQCALQRTITADAYLFLYKELVRLAGDRTFCWPGLEFLVNSLNTSVGTLKRWLRELEQAGLIRRVARSGGQTSITYITAYLAPEQPSADNTIPDDDAPMEDVPGPDDDTSAGSDGNARAQLFFAPTKGIKTDPNAGSNVILHTVKLQKKKDRICSCSAKSSQRTTGVLDPQADLLEREGVVDSNTHADLRTIPFSELEAISHYLDRQTNVRSRQSLFVWLARQRFGQALLKGRVAAKTTTTVLPDMAMSQPLPLVDRHLQTMWTTVLDIIRLDMSAEVFRTWLAPTTALLLDAPSSVVVVGTPNVFVRDELATHYLARLENVLAQVTGESMHIDLVIGT